MSKHRSDLTKNSVLPSTWVNALMEFVSTLVSNLNIVRASDTTISITGSTGYGQVSVGMGGVWRYNAVNITASHPGGAAGIYGIFVTGTANDFSLADPADATNYAFGMRILAPATYPGNPVWRQVGECAWDGTRITHVYPIIPGTADPRVIPPVGAQMAYSGVGDPPSGFWMLCDGRLLDRATPAGGSFHACAQHAYNNYLDPGANKVKLPDKRGRSSVGADQMLGTRLAGFSDPGAAGVLTTAKGHNNTRGLRDGFERHSLNSLESGMPTHTGSVTVNSAATGMGLNFGVAGNPLYDNTAPATSYNAANSGGGGTADVLRQSKPTLSDPTHGHTGLASITGQPAINEHNNLHPVEVDNWIVRVL